VLSTIGYWRQIPPVSEAPKTFVDSADRSLPTDDVASLNSVIMVSSKPARAALHRLPRRYGEHKLALYPLHGSMRMYPHP
jgi:hypothetical protein